MLEGMERLRAFGWSEHFERAWAALASPELRPARVVQEQRGAFRIQTAAAETRADVAGRLRQEGRLLPAVGDWTAVREAHRGQGAVIQQVLERRTAISRKAAGKGAREQVLAANVDTVFMVTSCDLDFSPRRIERYLTMVWESGATPVVLLNKSDLVGDPSALVREAEAVALGAAVHPIAAAREEGLAALAPYLVGGHTIALVGSSGVGKSTIVNRLAGRELQAVAEVRDDDAKGRHTTRSRQLFLLPCGTLVLDTPGLREIAPWLGDAGLGQAFADIEELARSCRFQDCVHDTEPDCAVKAAVGTGHLAGARLDSYQQLRRELDHLERQADAGARAEERRRWRGIHKELRLGRKKGWFR
jgi:ribosome biogenesis GTPase